MAVATTINSGTAVNSSRAMAVQSVYTAWRSSKLRHHLSKSPPCALLARSVTVLLFLGVMAPGVRASPLAAFQARAQRCLEHSHLQLCEQALIEAEALQRQASARSAYPCQTMLLGVQADLVMQQLEAGRGVQAMADLQAAIRGCAGL